MIVDTTARARRVREEQVVEAVANRLDKLTGREHNEFVGRLVEFLIEKGIITAEAAGNLFYEDWSK